MSDPTFGTMVNVNTGTALAATAFGKITCTGTENICAAIVTIARNTGQTMGSVVWEPDGANLAFTNVSEATVDDGVDERIELWYLASPPTTTNAIVHGTIASSGTARWSMHIVEIASVYAASPFHDATSTSVAAKSLSLTQTTLEAKSLAILAKKNSSEVPADSGSFSTHAGSTATTNGNASLNIQSDVDIVTTQVDVDQEVIATSTSWQWTAGGTRSASGLVIGVDGAQPSGIAASSSHPRLPHGIVALVQRNLTLSNNLLNDASIRGFGVRTHWKEIEATEGVYDWSYFDECVSRASSAGKFLNLRINCGTNGAPSWAYADVQMHNVSSPAMPIPWDDLWRTRRKTLMTAFGARYNSQTPIFGGPVRGVSAGFVNYANDDWDLPTTAADITALLNAGYTTTRLVNATTDYIDHVFTCFPQIPVVFMPYNGNGALDAAAITAATAVADYAYAKYRGRFVLMRNNLKATPYIPAYSAAVGTVWELMRTYRADLVGMQATWRIDGDTSKRQNDFVTTDGRSENDIMTASVDAVNDYLGAYYEIYSPDLRDAEQRTGWEGRVSTNPPTTGVKTRPGGGRRRHYFPTTFYGKGVRTTTTRRRRRVFDRWRMRSRRLHSILSIFGGI